MFVVVLLVAEKLNTFAVKEQFHPNHIISISFVACDLYFSFMQSLVYESYDSQSAGRHIWTFMSLRTTLSKQSGMHVGIKMMKQGVACKQKQRYKMPGIP